MSGENPDAQRGDIASTTNLGGALPRLNRELDDEEAAERLGLGWATSRWARSSAVSKLVTGGSANRRAPTVGGCAGVVRISGIG
jgi:hypothetical protein